MALCQACSNAEAAGRFRGAPFCEACIRPRVLAQSRTAPEFVSLAERLGALAALIPDQAIATFKRQTEDASAVAAVFRTFAEDRGAIRERIAASKERERRGDEELANDLDALMDDNYYYLHNWLASSECYPLVHYCAQHSELSLLDFIARLESEDHEAEGAWDGVKYALLGSDLTYRSLLESPTVSRLEKVEAIAFALGLTRMVELAGILRSGFPPSERFSEDERLLLDALESDSVRRASRTWHLYKDLALDTKDMNDRAEVMFHLWLLYPTKGPVRDYLRLMYDSYVRGEDAVTVILCRSVLERIVSEAYDRAITARPATPDTMNRKISFLQSQRLLTGHGSLRARDVWERGNKVVHSDPKLVTNVRHTIEATLQVVSELVR